MYVRVRKVLLMWILMELKPESNDLASISSYIAVGYATTQYSAHRWREEEPNKRFFIYCKNQEYVYNKK